MHLYHFERLAIQLEWELELLELTNSFVYGHEALLVARTLMTYLLLEELTVHVELIDIKSAIGA